MQDHFNPYEVLGADPSDAPAAIVRLYRRMSKTHHPDAGGDRAAWDRLTLAYQILSDPDRRAFYDQTGRIDTENPEHDRQQAHQIIAENIAGFADQFLRSNFAPGRDPRMQPVMELVAQYISNDLRETEKALQTGRSQFNFLRDFAKRVVRSEKATGIDQVAAILNQKISNIEQQIIRVEEGVRVRKIALAILADYSFERDRSEPATTGGGQFFTAATS